MLEKRQEGAPMDEAWKVFEASGKVTDYLEFCTARKEQEERPDGTEYCSDRDGLKCNADWRL